MELFVMNAMRNVKSKEYRVTEGRQYFHTRKYQFNIHQGTKVF